MPEYTFPPRIALNPTTGERAADAVIEVFERTDTTFATPLAVTDLSGVPVAALRSSADAVIPAFRVTASQPRVVVKSDSYTAEILSHEGLLEELAQAVNAAVNARIAAENAEGQVADYISGQITAAVIAQYINEPGDVQDAVDARVAAGGGGGGGPVPPYTLQGVVVASGGTVPGDLPDGALVFYEVAQP